MAHRTFLIRYPNGYKRHASQAEIDDLGSKARRVGPREYVCESLQADLDETRGPDFLDIHVIREHKGRREHEREATPKRMLARLKQMGWTPEQVSA